MFERNEKQSALYEPEQLFGSRFFGNNANFVKASDPSTEAIDSMELSSDGSIVGLARRSGIIELWQVRGFKKIAQIVAHRGAVDALAFSPNNSLIATRARDRHLKIWELKEKQVEPGKPSEFELTLKKDFEDLGSGVLAFGSDKELYASYEHTVVNIDLVKAFSPAEPAGIGG